jgi:hypothetical protein
MRFPLITSIPPRLSRLDASGVDVGDVYQAECIASWRRASFEAFSVNSAGEDTRCDLPTVRVHRDASQVTGRPHVFFADLLSVGAKNAVNGRFAIANADLIMKPDLAGAVDRLQPGELLFCRRIDVERVGQTEGTTYHSGFDFFATNVADVAGLRDSQLVFGAPWWDHYLPLMLHMRGCKLHLLEPSVVHLVHDERWDWTLWTALGQKFLKAISQSATDADYKARLKIARKGERSQPWWRLGQRQLPTKDVGEEIDHILHRVCAMNVLFLDERASVS